MKKILAEFKTFVLRGNVLDLAVGVIIGGAFQKIVNSLVNDIIMPVITLITGDSARGGRHPQAARRHRFRRRRRLPARRCCATAHSSPR